MMGIQKGEKKVYEYVTVPGVGLAINYAGIDVKGKIALVSRGDITFEEKVQFAQEAGAIAVIIYNNVYGDITMTIGNYAKIPAVSIGRDEGERLASRESGTFEFDLENLAGPFMSDFSSWGPTPDLKLKPEITAHGGNINSAVLGGEYDELSGTSMAAPNMCGITVLIRQYVKEHFGDLSAVEMRDLVNRLCMSTATIAKDKFGNPYSPRKQGAGLADIRKATTSAAYLLVEGIGKTKLELGDDPTRSGVYEMEISVVNISASAQSYRLGNITMTESVSAAEPEYVAEIAYLLSNSSEYSVVSGGTLTDGVLTVGAGETAKVKVKLTLSDADKSYLDSTFENGMYVEGYLTFDNTDENGVDLNAPFLAFYGNWGDAPIFDLDYYEVETEAHDGSIDEDDKIKADYYPTTPLGSYYYDYIIPLGTYLYEMDEDEFSPIPATREHAAVSFYKTSISGIYGVLAGLLRGAKELSIKIVNTETGEVAWEMVEYNCYKSHYRGIPYGYMTEIDLQMLDENDQLFASNNEHFEVIMSAKLDWEGGENVSDTYSFSFYVDYEAPSLTHSEYRVEYDKSREENRYYLDIEIYDNHYAMSCRPILIYDFRNEEDDVTKTFSSLTEYPIPVYQQNKGETSKVTIEITDYIDIIKRSATPNGITLYIEDYALNANIFYVPFPETDDEDIRFTESEVEVEINETMDLTTLFEKADGSELSALDYLQTLKWSVVAKDKSEDASAVIIKDGLIEGLKAGKATVRVSADTWVDYAYAGEDEDGRPIYNTTPKYKEITVKVKNTVKDDDPKSGKNVQIEDLFFSSYDTLFAFNSDIDFSKIGRTGSTNYFDGHYSIECYPSEKIQLNYELDPWNLAEERYELIWSSTNEKVATVDENGVVTAQAEGKARITLQIKIDGKTSLLAARLSVEVKSEFIIENRELVAYKGWGGDVVIPDDEGILYIGAYAFSHFDLDNKKYVPKDEDGYYDFDEKKTPIGNDTVTSVVVPEGVETINKYAFYNCSKLTKVTLPESCETIEKYAFQNSAALVDVNFDHVKIIADYAFDGCSSLSCAGLEGGVNGDGLYAVGEYAFRNTAIESISLSGLSRISQGAFASCTSLTTLKLGQRTRISESMFEGCTSLAEVVVYSDTVGNRAFAGCTSLTSLTLAGNVTYLGAEALDGCSALASFVVNGQLEQIGDKAFYGCADLEEVTLPDGKIAIGSNVFAESGLNKITFQENTEVESFGGKVFPLTNFTVDITDSNFYKIDGGAMYTKDGTVLVLVLPTDATTFTVGAEVVSISAGAFTAAKNLTVLNFASNSKLASIGANAFAGCTELTTVNLPAKSITIGESAFKGARKLSTINLSKVTEIGNSAFVGTALTTVTLSVEGVKVGDYAFSSTTALKALTLGKNAVVGEGAFMDSALVSVDLLGNAVIGSAAFKNCVALNSFDFADLEDAYDADGNLTTQAIGSFAFYGCKSLATVNAPKISVIGEGSFAGCTALKSFLAENVVTIMEGAFYDVSVDVADIKTSSTQLTTLNFPKLVEIGDYAFTASVLLQSANMPELKTIGAWSFAYCENLETITFSEELTVVPERAFLACLKLSNFDFTNIERVGMMAFFYAKLPAKLVLENVTHLDRQAFAEGEDKHILESVTAPKLTYVDDEAFIGCNRLKTVNAPMIEHIGSYAFVQTAIEEFEISTSLNYIGKSAFVECEKFQDFYIKEDGEEVYSAELECVMIDDGVLYVKNARGYTLYCYPAAKTETEFEVAEGTTRIEFQAAALNKHLEKVTFPSSLRSIADFAFYGCDALTTVTFKSYKAPTLEGLLSIAKGEPDFITVENIEQFPGFDDIYKYNYSYMIDGWTPRNLYHTNFKAGVGGEKAVKMTAIVPEVCVGYDSLLYNAYFNLSEEENSGISAGRYAIDFMDAVYNLPENIDRFDRLLMEAAINAYNALEAHADEMQFVDDNSMEKFERLRSIYNVNVVEGKLARLFGMYNSEYCFNLLKDATSSYLALTEAERAMVNAAGTLDEKKAQLAAAMGVDTIDFNLTYAQNLPAKDPSEDPGADDGSDAVLIIIIVSASVLVLAAAGAVVFFLLKKKKAPAPVNTEAEAIPEEESEESSCEENSDAKEDSDETKN